MRPGIPLVVGRQALRPWPNTTDAKTAIAVPTTERSLLFPRVQTRVRIVRKHLLFKQETRLGAARTHGIESTLLADEKNGVRLKKAAYMTVLV